MRKIDHIVYSVPDLEAAIIDLEKRLGVPIQSGGRHLNKGTKNAVLNLGNSCYLEILAADESNTDIAPPRWMGVDLIDQAQMTRWCIKSDDLNKDGQILQNINPALGQQWNGERQLQNGDFLRWKMNLPLATPAVDVLPFMCDWSNTAVHPTEQLVENCELIAMRFYHPKPESIQPYFNALQVEIKIAYAKEERIEADIKCPNGIITI
ncbi:MAG: VOC family protein [Saprospiraceae bacterium]